ncbi:FeoB-associated Cys-rich membrane protein [Jejuia spongiicola]|uniref:FeoB-associated Cys-rich membrane protein n=1 Tax=Jejuia spongiicola TaxID=2942207 RepID=A0ABT0QCF0_9FLAO|nr:MULTISPECIES: FeoB-associated Cys-rich membrane protein [Flavobacteriaceae]MCL6293650.1 FeoB-associated Cys-rich membrane protein [Jejuia spongiicola]
MNIIIQNILAFTVLGLALAFIVKKFVWKPKKKSAKVCGGDDGCGCH